MEPAVQVLLSEISYKLDILLNKENVEGISIFAASKRMRVSRHRLNALIASGSIPAYREGKRLKIRVDDIKRYQIANYQ